MNKLIQDSHDAWVKEAIALRKLHMDALKEIEQLRADKAALLECLRWYANDTNYDDCDGCAVYTEIDADQGFNARECIAKLETKGR